MEIFEAHLTVSLNGNVEVVCILYHAVIHTADTACDERPAVQTGAGIAVCQAQDLCCDSVGDVLCDEFGGLDAVNNQPQLIRLKSVCFHPVAARAVVVGNFNAVQGIQNVLVAVEGLDFEFIAVVAVVGQNVRYGGGFPLTGVLKQILIQNGNAVKRLSGHGLSLLFTLGGGIRLFFVRAAQKIVSAGMVEIRQPDQNVRWNIPFAHFIVRIADLRTL